MSPAGRTFYLASSINTPDNPRGGGSLATAQRLAYFIEGVTGDRCIARWPFHKLQNQDHFLPLMAVVNLEDIAQADYVVVVPLTSSSRGCHVELGMALAMGKPTYLYRPPGQDEVAFDQLCMKPPADMLKAIKEVLFSDPGDAPDEEVLESEPE